MDGRNTNTTNPSPNYLASPLQLHRKGKGIVKNTNTTNPSPNYLTSPLQLHRKGKGIVKNSRGQPTPGLLVS
jgi:hypothetical protein